MRRVFAFCCGCLLLVSVPGWAEEAEVELTPMQLPAHVLESVRKKVKGFEVEEVEVSAMLIFEIVGEVDEKDVELCLTAEGEIFKVEFEKDDADDEQEAEPEDDEADGSEEGDEEEQEVVISAKALPKHLLKAVRQKFPEIEIEAAAVESLLVYTIEGEAGDQEYEIEVTAEGDVIEVEKAGE